MGSNIPKTIPGFLDWAGVHAERWQQHASAVGISNAQAAEFRGMTERVVEAQRLAAIARQAALTATQELHLALGEARDFGGVLVRVVKSHAEITNNLEVYALGGVSPADQQGTVAAPTAPTSFDKQLNSDGSLTITWKATQPEGVTDVQYQIHRRFPTDAQRGAPFILISTAGSNKTFTDRTIPAGTPSVEYMLLPTRGDVAGPPSNAFTVQFGSQAAARTLAMKMAA